MNNDYISRQALFDAYEQEQMRIGAWSFEKLLKSIPAADVAPVVHGKWFGTVCSNCGARARFYRDCDYCPNCGAKMDG